MTIGGIDLGGTKIDVRAFDADLATIAQTQIPTPDTYDALIAALASQVRWLDRHGPLEHVGLGTPGVIRPDGVMLTANLPATGRRLRADLAAAVGREVAVVKDCRAFALAEAVQGAGRGARNIVGLVIGTGVAGGWVLDGALPPELNGQLCEIGQVPLPADLVAAHDLPLVRDALGQVGAFETLLSGPGLARLAAYMGFDATPEEVLAEARYDAVVAVWAEIAAALVGIIARTFDPEVVVFGGGVGRGPRVVELVAEALPGRLLPETEAPRLVTAALGEAGGALGAALYAERMA